MYCGTIFYWLQEVLNIIPVGLVACGGTLTGRWHLFQVVEIGDGRGCMEKGRLLRSLDRKTQVRTRLCPMLAFCSYDKIPKRTNL